MRFPEFRQEWQHITLRDITKLITKGTTPAKFVNQGIKFIKIECFIGDRIDNQKCLFIDENVHNKELKRSILQENDLLFAIAGATIGKVNIVQSDILPANTNQALAIIRLKEQEDPKFIYQILKSDTMRKYIRDSISVGAQPNLNLEQINDFSFFQPAFAEQQKIASILSLIDERIQTQNKIIEELNVFKTTVTKRIFSGELKFTDDRGNHFPKWEYKTLGEIGEFSGGGTPTSSNANFWNGNIPWVSSSDLSENNIHSISISRFITGSALNNSATKLCEAPLILIVSRVGVGKVAFSNRALCTSQDFLNMHNFSCDGVFLTYLLSIEMKRAASSTQGTSIKGISSAEIKSKRILLPCITEQVKIASFLHALDNKIDIEVSVLQKIVLQKQYLLRDLFI